MTSNAKEELKLIVALSLYVICNIITSFRILSRIQRMQEKLNFDCHTKHHILVRNPCVELIIH